MSDVWTGFLFILCEYSSFSENGSSSCLSSVLLRTRYDWRPLLQHGAFWSDHAQERAAEEAGWFPFKPKYEVHDKGWKKWLWAGRWGGDGEFGQRLRCRGRGTHGPSWDLRRTRQRVPPPVSLRPPGDSSGTGREHPPHPAEQKCQLHRSGLFQLCLLALQSQTPVGAPGGCALLQSVWSEVTTSFSVCSTVMFLVRLLWVPCLPLHLRLQEVLAGAHAVSAGALHALPLCNGWLAAAKGGGGKRRRNHGRLLFTHLSGCNTGASVRRRLFPSVTVSVFIAAHVLSSRI